ncbi:MAG TPA: amidohydrolase family protein [Thermoanaerobaculia bacterium]|nr:amidohydrolase family protein [Thermoanaerobaculia bacterium]
MKIGRTTLFLAGMLSLALPLRADDPKTTLALVGGQIIDGYEGTPISDGVILVAGNRIRAVGRRSEIPVPPGVPVIDTRGMSVMPGLADMHVHLMILGHSDYEYWDKKYSGRFATEIMPIAAKQLLESGVTFARDLGAPLEDSLAVRGRIARGEIPGPRLFVSGPFIQKKAYNPWEESYRWGVNGAADARAKVKRLVDAGVDMIKLIDQDQLTDDEVKAVVETAHAGGKPVVAHAHREDEIRMGLKYGIDSFEHTGLATEPGYPEDILAGIRKRNNTLYWCPTIEGLFLADYTARTFPERLNDPAWQKDMPPEMALDIRKSLESVTHLDYFTLTFRRLPTLAHKFQQLRDTGVTLLVGTDSGIPGNFHTDSTWRELDMWVKLGMTPMQAIAGATRWPARFLRKENELGTIAPGRYADIVAVRGDVLSNIGLLQHVDVVVKDGKRVK